MAKILEFNSPIVGSGDPTLSRNNLVKLLNQVKIKHIIGNIYIDNSVFNSYPKYSMLKEEQYDPDTVLPDGLMIDEHLSKFTLHTKNSINVTSNLYGYKIDNKLIINPKLKYCSHNINKRQFGLSKLAYHVVFQPNFRFLAQQLITN